MTEHNWEESATFWRDRANKFELALREIKAIEDELYSGVWDKIDKARSIASGALEESKKG